MREIYARSQSSRDGNKWEDKVGIEVDPLHSGLGAKIINVI